MKKLFEHALDIVPEHAVEDTPIFLFATAGMRLLPESQRKALLRQICSYARSETKFLISDCDSHIQVIPGEIEGLYGWIAANYLLGGFDPTEEQAHRKDHPTYGFLDMGGASAQIAFAPNSTEALRHAEDLKLLRMRTLDGAVAEYKVFVTTWLGFGVNEARKRYIETLMKLSGTAHPKTLQDPCLPVGLSTTVKGDIFLPGPRRVGGKNPYLVGTGQFDRCLNQTLPLLNKDVVCTNEPCLLDGVHVPAIDFDVNRFVGVSEYWHTTHEIFEWNHKDKAYDFNTYQQRVSEFCSTDWSKIQEGIDQHSWGSKVDEKTAIEVCFKASWLINVLHEGIGIPRVGLEKIQETDHNGTKEVLHNAKAKGFTSSFQAVNKIDDTEVSWTLGKIVLYASSQVPPKADNKFPVGFGSNVAGGNPSDFQYGGIYNTPPTNVTVVHESPSDANAEDWHDTLFAGQTPRRIPGFFLFVLILCLAFFLLCGRERRKRLYRKVVRSPHLHSRKRKFFSPLKLPRFLRPADSSAGGSYERILEDGEAADQFELRNAPIDGGDGDYDNSDDSVDSWTVKSSGWATPRVVGGMANSGVLGGGAAGDYFDGLGEFRAGTVGLGITRDPMGRSGLVGRTESRERLPAMAFGEGRRSRVGSPTRGGKSASLRVLEED